MLAGLGRRCPSTQARGVHPSQMGRWVDAQPRLLRLWVTPAPATPDPCRPARTLVGLRSLAHRQEWRTCFLRF